MMGAGKTSVGLIVSKRLKLNYVDIDEKIENELSLKIQKIFETKGESFFRKIEEKITLKTLKKSKNVISIGGGAFLNQNIRNEILQNHISFWLDWNPKTLINRISNSFKRPVAFKASKNELLELINKRSKIYSKALYKVNCENLTKNQIVTKILKIYEDH